EEDFYKDISFKWSFPEQEHIVDHELRNYPNINKIYRNLLIISSFDFDSQLDVNILGHIFENSITDIEEIKNEKTSKRKKEGVYYTPDYITKYICENTIIPYLSNNENNKIDDLIKEYQNNIDELENKLINIKIVDPACGSGAFLNKATEILLDIHKAIYEFRYENSNKNNLDYIYDDIDNRRDILLNNIYGVDLNQESIEITKLGLFLKVCKKGMPLPNLDKTIKCGNSLINDLGCTHKPLQWKKEFSEIFKNGGFDIVIGNPPYIKADFIPPKDKEYFEKNYNSAYGRINTYPLFYEKGLNLLKNQGLLGFITPYTILKNQYYKEARKFILENSKILELVDFKGITVFQDATVDSIVMLLKKGVTENYEFKQISNIVSFENQQYKIEFFNISGVKKRDDLSFFLSENDSLIDKINDNTIHLNEIIKFNQGIITGGNKKFLTYEKSNLTKPIITGSDFNRYSLKYSGQLIIYDAVKLHRPRKKEIFEVEEKILLRQTGSYPICALDSNKFYTLDTVHNGILINSNFELKYILCLLNSKLIQFLYESSINESGKVFAQVKIIYINPLPIKSISLEKQKIFVDLAKQIINKNKELHDETNSFHKYLRSDFNVSRINNKLNKYYELSFDDLYKEVKKQNKEVTRKQKDILEKEFIESVDIIKPLKSKISNIDNEIDKKVYELYDLTNEEIKIIKKEINM
ncbi:MAG: Eco57I restriction-modification methylase domain-containing protein, partial [Methanobrevibacter sp.]|nr:Eco57I restriction-modification methylase domain-containing protein [Methanobrevibacter sp.]